MPRVYTSQNNPLDFCRRHMPGELAAKERYGNLGDGPDGRGNCFAYDADHPPYEGVMARYKCKCVTCGCQLGPADD